MLPMLRVQALVLAAVLGVGCQQAASAEPDEPPAEAAPTEPAAAAVIEDLEPPSSPVDGLTLRRVRFRDRTFRVASLDLRRVDLQLAGQGPEITRPATFSQLRDVLEGQGRRLVWGTNAGIFRQGGRPSGLYVEGGREVVPLETRSGSGNFYLKPNGAFLVGEGGARIRTTAELSAQPPTGVRLATQSGPLLCRDGVLHDKINPDSKNLLLRSGVGVTDPHTVHFAMSEGSVRFHELATLFRDGLGAPDALYLDGVISQWVAPDLPPGSTDGGFGGLFFVAGPAQPEP